MRPRFRWRAWLQNAQTLHWLWTVGVPGLLATIAAGAIRAWTNFGPIWQALSAFFIFIVVLGTLDLAVGRVRARRRAGFSDDELAVTIEKLAQQMIENLAEAQRATPPPPVATTPHDATGEELHRAWAEGVRTHAQHEQLTLARFKERFGLEMSQLVTQLRERDYISDEEAHSFYWNLRTLHWLENLPHLLVTWAHRIKQKSS